MPKNHYPKQGRNMHYKLIVTDEMEKFFIVKVKTQSYTISIIEKQNSPD